MEIGTLRGVLLLAHGGPSSLEDVPAFLEAVRGGRPYSDQLLEAMREKYRFIGGASPLTDIARRAAAKLETECGLPVYIGMLHWHPFLEDAVAQMQKDGISKALAICLVPHFSDCSVGRYQRRIASAVNGSGVTVDLVDSWHVSPPYLEGLVDSVIAARRELASTPTGRTHVIFSAHSLPKAAMPPGDPYELQLRETAERVAEKLALAEGDWTVAYQSTSGPGQDWLSPSIDEVMSDLAGRGIGRVVLCPCGFVADQVEVLYDLDVVMSRKAEELGISVARAPLLNDGPALIESLALLVGRWKE